MPRPFMALASVPAPAANERQNQQHATREARTARGGQRTARSSSPERRAAACGCSGIRSSRAVLTTTCHRMRRRRRAKRFVVCAGVKMRRGRMERVRCRQRAAQARRRMIERTERKRDGSAIAINLPRSRSRTCSRTVFSLGCHRSRPSSDRRPAAVGSGWSRSKGARMFVP